MGLFRSCPRVNLADCAGHLRLAAHTPALVLDGLIAGVDNVRHDVCLSAQFTQLASSYLMHLIARFGNMEDMIAQPAAPSPRGVRREAAAKPPDSGAFKSALASLHLAAVQRAKNENNICVDLLARLAVLKFLRSEVVSQFNLLLERCRARLVSLEGPRQGGLPKVMELRDRTGALQMAKKPILRKVAQEILQTYRDLEKESLARTRRSLFGEDHPAYDLLLCRFAFGDDPHDDVLNAEHYVMFGNFERDADRFLLVRGLVLQLFEMLGLEADDSTLNAPENAEELTGSHGEDSRERALARRAIRDAWVGLLETAEMMQPVLAAYHVVPLISEYSPPVNPQQLKSALISKAERKRVEALIEQHPKLSSRNLETAAEKVARYKGEERAHFAARFLRDFFHYHREVKRLEVLDLALDLVNLITSDKVRELSAINRTLYEFLLGDQPPTAADRILYHVILKADIRDSTTLVRELLDRGLNPASYFSLNFYDPVNKLLPKYDAHKLFIEGDAVILALFAREGEAPMAVARACALAREIIDIVGGYNQKSSSAGLPNLELGIGVACQEGAPMYLLDGDRPIMISQALNQSDRLASCSHSARKLFAEVETLFNVYCFRTVAEGDSADLPDEFLMRYNVAGVQLEEEAFQRLQRELSLEVHELPLPALWDESPVRLHGGVVPLGSGLFQKLIVRESCVPQIAPHNLELTGWTEKKYFEVCTCAEVYDYIEQRSSGLAAVAGPAK